MYDVDRHDEEHEKAQDEARARINASHRYGSFAGQRDGNVVKWYEHSLTRIKFKPY